MVEKGKMETGFGFVVGTEEVHVGEEGERGWRERWGNGWGL